MDFLKNNRRFDLSYGGRPFAELSCSVEQTQEGDTLTTVYSLPDGLKITNIATRHGDACEWVNRLENTGDQPSEIISELYDAAISLPLPHEEPQAVSAWLPQPDEGTHVYVPAGGDTFFTQRKHIRVGKSRTYAPYNGRSSRERSPFFNVHKDGKGYIFAIGWTGQWNCYLEREEDEIIVKTGIEDTHFRLLPGEKIRTSSFVLLPYEGTVQNGQNQWRRLVREHYSLIGKEGREQQGPLFGVMWGGLRSSRVLERIEAVKKYQLPFEYIWMDAGWYGDTDPTPNEFVGDWPEHTGNWTVSPKSHPGGLKDVSAAVHGAGMKYLLWAEPERVRRATPIAKAHPEYFLDQGNAREENLLLDLGNEEAWRYCVDTVAGLIEDIGIDCYRQDFNFSPLPYWRKNDAADRRGITEIKHIMGLYRFWDALLEKFPHLLIDNCASGGLRIDVETLRRSIPLWRTDYTCPANWHIDEVQCHHLSYNSWLPYSGTGGGRPYDTYRIRSAYSPALGMQYFYSEDETDFGADPEKIEWLRARIEEYKRVRPYFEGDFYPLTGVSDRTDCWSACQFAFADKGMVQLFRREHSPYETASFSLYDIDEAADYLFTDPDDGEQIISGKELVEGFTVTMKEKRSAKIYLYKKI